MAPDLEAITALAPGPFGGNMDVPDVKPGNTVYLPVWNSGALVYTGDCHARQGQGELCGVAMEIISKVTVVFEVIKEKAIEWPRIESDEAIMVVGSARPMEDAAASRIPSWCCGWSRNTATIDGMPTSCSPRQVDCTWVTWLTPPILWLPPLPRSI